MDSDSSTELTTEPEAFPLHKGDILSSSSTQYRVLDFNGEGCFGSVVKCTDLTTNKLVAIKVHKDIPEKYIQRELKMLKAVRALDPEKNNIVDFMDHFRFNNFSCMAFEILDKSLWDLMETSMPLCLNQIRPVVHQLLVAFEALKGIGILHTDLKPDNVMLVNHKDQPFRVKLIDFGMALPVSEVRVGMMMQADGCRAPEVTLGLPLTGAVDMWGLGCTILFLYFDANLFGGDCAYHRMKALVHMLGQPGDHTLSAGLNTSEYFSRNKGFIGPRWRLKTPGEYKEATGNDPDVDWDFFDIAKNLKDLIKNSKEKRNPLEYKDRMEFLSFLKLCLHMDAACRLTPREALEHPFITMAHLVDEMGSSSYADEALKLMAVSNLQDFDESEDSLTDMELRGDQASNYDGVSGTNSSSSEDKDIDNSKDDTESRESCSNLNEDSSPTVLESGSSTSSDEHLDTETSSSAGPSAVWYSSSDSSDSSDSSVSDSLYEAVRDTTTPTKESGDTATSSNDNTHTEISNSARPSAATDSSDSSDSSVSDSLYEAVRDTTVPPLVGDTTTPTKESGDAATSSNDNTHTDRVPIISGTSSTTNDDIVSAAAGSTDGVAASFSSNDGAAAAITPDDVKKKKKKKNVFQRTCNFFRRLKKRVVAALRPQQN